MENNYAKNFLKTASGLDAITRASGEITKLADSVINEKSEITILKLYKNIVEIIQNDDYSKETHIVATTLKENLIQYLGFIQLKEICTQELLRLDPEKNKSLEELLQELNNLVGLEKVKAEVSDLVAYQKVQKLRREIGFQSPKSTMHMAFMGNPGTGKTSVARIVGRIYKQLGLLSKGHFLEVSRTDLIAGYQGQTALKVKNVIESIKGGVLFIDEAYSITENDHSDSYGRECLTELTKALEDYRDDLVVIVAGYTEPMQDFFKSNPGLVSRFNKFIYFDDYSENELLEIFKTLCKQNDYLLSEHAENRIIEIFRENIENKPDQFANGRFARNLFEDAVMNHARRVAKKESPVKNDLSELLLEDIQTNNGNCNYEKENPRLLQ